MDPNASVAEINAEYAKGLEPRNDDRIAELVDALARWMANGGCAPSVKISERAWKWGHQTMRPLYPWFRQLATEDAIRAL